ncbi:universal stress protein [Chryseolinea lacunae]|uniref:Universal stress protein n=1 Tax=Chryseolinea lacunae TaxID=2801331 RepID=A0ABS1L2R3_9BACT|nr:universal stress protein [Chryseolinea lacunae]MBL0745738.1 universal stress protein [Chryseolinea lacunae]
MPFSCHASYKLFLPDIRRLADKNHQKFNHLSHDAFAEISTFRKKHKRILVPCDFSQPAHNASLVASERAAKSKGEIIVLHVIYLPALTKPYYGTTPISYRSGLISQMDADAQAGIERITQKMPADIPVKLQTEMGNV